MKSTAKIPQGSVKQQHVKLILISGAVILALAAVLVFAIVFIPRIKAGRCLDEIAGILKTSESCELILVSDMKSGTDALGSGDGEAVISEREAISELSEKLDGVIDGVKYAFSKNMSYGAWGIRLRFYVLDSKYEIYLEKTRIYVLDGNKVYYFVPESADGESGYAEIYAYVLALIGEQVTE